ncbi:MAG TPA: electron-transfer flavoprotein:ubiquinone oxidoreductase [Solirubrobacterales bacterium]|nr:electron-transfer flavoprotein:ubiquinone oxidoreductase [Solirubrobacterales bacterium]
MSVVPNDFPPPVDETEFITEPTDPEEERIEVGVAIVGGGPAGLACANRLLQLLAEEPELTDRLGEVPVAVIEKGKACGAHGLSGANLRPAVMRELFPDLEPADWPFAYQEVTKDAVYLLTKKLALPLVPMPPNFRNHGNYVVSVAKLSRFLAERAEEAGAYILTETVADKLLVSDRVVRGIRSGDRGRGKDGEPLANFEPGADVVASATVLAEGTLGHLTQAATEYFDLHGALPVRWELGVKEVWEVPEPLDRVIHTMGWPLRKGAKRNEFGGSFIYPMGEDKLCIGMVIGLDYTDATLSCHDLLQELKTHPFVRQLLEGGKRVAWGAKTIPSGGFWSMPRSLAVPGMVIAGDAASMVNVPELKGIHYAMYAGMYAAEAIVAALKREETDFAAYHDRVHESVIGTDLFRSRNMRQPFSKGFFVGGAVASAMTITQGAFPGGKWKHEADTEIAVSPDGAASRYPEPDNELTFNKLDSVFLSGNATRDDAPNHVRVQEHVPRELAQTWVSLCPAQVYEIPEDQLAGNAPEVDVHVTPSNCVQCGAINAKGGRLTMPEGGDGPLYQET